MSIVIDNDLTEAYNFFTSATFRDKIEGVITGLELSKNVNSEEIKEEFIKVLEEVDSIAYVKSSAELSSKLLKMLIITKKLDNIDNGGVIIAKSKKHRYNKFGIGLFLGIGLGFLTGFYWINIFEKGRGFFKN